MSSPPNKLIILALACAAQFMVVLDIAIVNVALPSIRSDLRLGSGSVQWIVIAYSLTLGGFVLLGGRAGDLVGRRRILLTGLSVFTLASLLAGLSGSAGALIAARVTQGLGAAMIPAAALSIVAVTFAEGPERNRALGVFGATGGISATVGVIASGLLTDGPGWRWVFFINVPIGGLLIALAVTHLPDDRAARGTRGTFDALGAITVTAGLMALLYGLDHGAEHGWTTAVTLLSFAVAALALASFGIVESRSAAPLVPAVAVRHRPLVAANLTGLLAFAAFFAFIFLGSLFMQQVLGYSALDTGFAWLATSLTSFVAAALTGAKLAGRFGVQPLLVIGLLVEAAAMVLLTRAQPNADYVSDLLPAFALAGIGGGLAFPSVQISALTGVVPSLTGLASGLIETAREIGGAAGVAAASTAIVTLSGATQFHHAFWIVGGLAAAGAVVAATTLPRPPRASTASRPQEQPVGAIRGGPGA